MIYRTCSRNRYQINPTLAKHLKHCIYILIMSSKRKSLTLRERVECLKLLDMGMHARDIANEFGVGRTQVMMVRKRKDEIMHQFESNVNLDMKRAASVRDTIYSELNSLVYNWLLDAKSRLIKVTGYVVQQKARKFANDLGLKEFKGSHGWLCGFLRRNNIELKNPNTEKDHYDTQEWNNKIKASIEQYSPANIFTMAEFGLFFKDSTESFKRGKTCAGGDLLDQRITVALCLSMTGEKLTPLVIGKFQKPNCLTGIPRDKLPVQYETNSKAWMCTPLMKDWLKSLNNEMQAKKRKILLFLNSSPVHPSVTFSNVKLQFIPANLIMGLQPMNAGIIKSVKLKYRLHQLQHVLLEMDKNPTKLGPEILHEISILQAINWISAAWQETTKDTIVKSFVKCGFNMECDTDSTPEREDNETNELDQEDKYPPELHEMSLELFSCYISELTSIDQQFVTCGNEMTEWERPAHEILSCPNTSGGVVNRVSSLVNPDLHHITMLVSSEQENSIRLLFRDKKWPCILKVLSDENVGSLIQNGFTDLFPTMERDSTAETEIIEIKSEVINEDERTAEDNNSNMHASNFSITESNDIATDPGIAEDKSDLDNKMVEDMHDKSGPETYVIIQDKIGIESNDKIHDTAGVESYDMIQTQIKVEPIEIDSENVQDDKAEDNIENNFSSFQEEMWTHRLVGYHEPHVMSSTSEETLTPEAYIAMGHIKCEYCNDFFPHHRSLKRHMYAVHRDLLPKWKCVVCGDEFESRDELWLHKRQSQHGSTMSNAPNYQCESCGRIFSRCSSFKEHKVSCKTQAEALMATTEFPCEVCGMLFKSMARVKRHKRQVHIIAPVMCNICGETCKNRRSLLSHRRRHDNKNRKYRCEECGKTFFNNTLLTQHIRTHTKEKPYKCPLCNYRCAIKQNIHKHAQKVHKTAAKAVDLSADVPKESDPLHDTEANNIDLDLSEDPRNTSMQDT